MKMINPYAEYFINQVGTGLRGFSGVRYQRGHGFFSRLWTSALLPAAKWLGKKALGTTINIADDIMEGKNVKESLKRRALESGKDTAHALVKRAKIYHQTGRGKPFSYKCRPLKRRKLLRKKKRRIGKRKRKRF